MAGWGSSCKSSREPICPGAMPGGVCCARWPQIDATARSDVPCRPLEWRLPCQMICGKAWNRVLTAVRGRLVIFLQITARANVPWSDAWRGSRRSMDTNRCHRASRCALQARRMAIAVPDDICRKRGQRTITICGNGENRCTGGLAPIIEVRISGPPGSGTLRGVDTDIWRKDIRTVTRPMWWKRNGAQQSHRGP